MCDCHELEYPEFYREKERTARVPHKCSECHQVIAPKTAYLAINGKWAGEILTYKQCLSCKKISEDYRKQQNCCVALGGLFTAIANSEISENY